MKLKKWCWLATETKKGWRLKLALGNKDYNLVGALFESEKDIKKIARSGKIVFIHLKDAK